MTNSTTPAATENGSAVADDVERMVADGAFLDAVEALTATYRQSPSPEAAQRIVNLRHRAVAEVDGVDGNSYEVCPMLIGEQSPICTDTGMRATLKGLYAIGDCSYSGSAAAGAVPAPPGRNRGSGILNAVFAAMVCSETIDNDAHMPGGALPVNDDKVAKLTADLLAPLERKEGCTAEDVIEVVHQAICPSDYSIIMTEERIAEALKIVMKAKEMVPAMKANDWHELMCCHEAEAMVLSAELHYRASSMRKESRGWFLREDYPERDDANWLKHTLVHQDEGGLRISYKPVTLGKYEPKPRVY